MEEASLLHTVALNGLNGEKKGRPQNVLRTRRALVEFIRYPLPTTSEKNTKELI